MDFDIVFRKKRSGRNVRKIIVLPYPDVSEPETLSGDELDHTSQQSCSSSDKEFIDEDDASANAYRTPELLSRITFETNRKAYQCLHSTLAATEAEIEVFTGMLIVMGFTEMPRYRMYWENQTRVDAVANCMSRNRFETLLRFLHFNDDDKVIMDRNYPMYDRFYKVRPRLENIRKTCLEETPGELQSVDEHIIPYKGRCKMKYYNPKKPCKWGLKLFARCGKNGFVHDFWLCDRMAPKVENPIGFFGMNVVMKTSRLPADSIECTKRRGRGSMEFRRTNDNELCVVKCPSPAIVREYNQFMGGVDLTGTNFFNQFVKDCPRTCPSRTPQHRMRPDALSPWEVRRDGLEGRDPRRTTVIWERANALWLTERSVLRGASGPYAAYSGGPPRFRPPFPVGCGCQRGHHWGSAIAASGAEPAGGNRVRQPLALTGGEGLLRDAEGDASFRLSYSPLLTVSVRQEVHSPDRSQLLEVAAELPQIRGAGCPLVETSGVVRFQCSPSTRAGAAERGCAVPSRLQAVRIEGSLVEVQVGAIGLTERDRVVLREGTICRHPKAGDFGRQPQTAVRSSSGRGENAGEGTLAVLRLTQQREIVEDWCRAWQTCAAWAAQPRKLQAPMQLQPVNQPFQRVVLEVAGGVRTAECGGAHGSYDTGEWHFLQLRSTGDATLRSGSERRVRAREGGVPDVRGDQNPGHSLPPAVRWLDWDAHLDRVLLAYRSSVHRTTGATPSRIVFGRELRLLVDLVHGLPRNVPEGLVGEYTQRLRQDLEQHYKAVRGKEDRELRRHQFRKPPESPWTCVRTGRLGLEASPDEDQTGGLQGRFVRSPEEAGLKHVPGGEDNGWWYTSNA
ncbi:PiggyBac transposable element-derived protein 3 [Trichinella sp. T8]|nr:PiggyBac transposable element-derived protein 3 [Trichinella sp. T8]